MSKEHIAHSYTANPNEDNDIEGLAAVGFSPVGAVRLWVMAADTIIG